MSDKRSRLPSPGGGGSPAERAGRGESAAAEGADEGIRAGFGGAGDATSPLAQPGGSADRMRRFRLNSAKALRARSTDAERKLWRALDRLPLEGTHFRRQVSIGPYVADFGCLAARLLIELDAGHHSRDDVAARDRDRQAWLEQEGYRVLRFWNAEVFQNLEGVLDTIYAALHGGTAAEARRFLHRRRQRPALTSPERLPVTPQAQKGMNPAQDEAPAPSAPAPSPLRGGCAADPPPPGEGGPRGHPA